MSHLPVAGDRWLDKWQGRLVDHSPVTISIDNQKSGRFSHGERISMVSVIDLQLQVLVLLTSTQTWMRGIYAWSKCSHENVLQMLGLAIFRNQLATVSPWWDHRGLLEYIDWHPNVDRCQLVRQICSNV
jgi:hypothetical protein